MPEDRKYRQAGYREAGRRDETRRPEPMVSSAGPIGAGRGVSRCADCGALLATLADPQGDCPGCGTPLHACKQCTHFDPRSRFECTQPIPERLPDKSARNACPLFTLRVVVERIASSAALRPEDARKAFKNLFKR